MKTARRFSSLAIGLIVLAGCVSVGIEAQGDLAQGSFERTLNVNGPVDLSVRTGSGDIQIRTGSNDRVQVIGRISASRSSESSESPAERVKRIEAAPPVVQNGNVISIGETRGDTLYNNVSISYELVVPANTQVNASTGSGNQSIGSVDGAIRARTGSGDIRIERTGGGLQAQTGSGSIRVAAVGGEVRAQTGSGNVDVTQVTRGDVSVQTGSGDVILRLPSDAAFTLDASTGSGSISTAQAITMQGRLTRNHIAGTVRGGGNAVRIRTGSGSIDIR
jgi:putative adhesin